MGTSASKEKLINSMQAYVHKLETNSCLNQLSHSIFGGYSKEKRLNEAKRLLKFLEQKGDVSNDEKLAPWCEVALEHNQIGAVFSMKWEGPHPLSPYASGAFLLSLVSATVLALATLTLIPQVVVAVLGALSLALSVYLFYHVGDIDTPEISSAVIACS